MPFIAYPSAFLHERPDRKSAKVEHYPWGYFVTPVQGAARQGGFVKVRCRWQDDKKKDRDEAWIREEDLQAQRPLEINFVDIGQGDGAFVVLPDDKRLLIDAGEGDNMYRFLRWRFRTNRGRSLRIQNVVITHPDQDHYQGLRELVDDPAYSFGNVFHNGVVERTGSASIGPREDGFLTDVIETPEQLEALLTPALVGRKRYPQLLRAMLDSGRIDAVWMLHTEDTHVPGYAPGEDASGVVIEVLGPFPVRHGDRVRLPWFSDAGKTKNGNSVVLRLRYGNLKVLLGGDLNIPAEDWLLRKHTGLDPTPLTAAGLADLIATARPKLEADVMKACHHGSADFRTTFLEAVNPAAIVTSSGDDEPHSHPRPDALGAFGKYSRGTRPLIFSTELARSTREYRQTPQGILEQLDEQLDILGRATATDAEKAAARKRIDELTDRRERAVAVYGMITVTSDGTRATIRQKLERKRSLTGEKWDIYRLEPGSDGVLRYESKHE